MSKSTRRRRPHKVSALALPATGVLAMLAIAIIMLVVALTDVELSFDFGADDNAQVIAAEEAK